MIGSIISGTHRNQDIIPTLEHALSAIASNLEYEHPDHGVVNLAQLGFNPTIAHSTIAQLAALPYGPVPAYAREDPDSEWWDSEDANNVSADLMEALTACAPADYYFGAHPSDGSDFGVWRSEEEE